MSFITHLARNDRAENSIMQTITIAVSAILIASGLVTAPGLINNARDNNATSDLANIAYAQEFVLSIGGTYYEYITPEQEAAATGNPSTGNNLKDAAQSAGLNGYNRLASSSTGETTPKDSGVKFSLSGGVTGHKASVCADPAFYIIKAQSKSGKWFYRGSNSALTSNKLSDINIPNAVTAGCSNIVDDFEETDTNGNPGGGNPGGGGTQVPAFDLITKSAKWQSNDPSLTYDFNIIWYNYNSIPLWSRIDPSHIDTVGPGDTVQNFRPIQSARAWLDGQEVQITLPATSEIGFYQYIWNNAPAEIGLEVHGDGPLLIGNGTAQERIDFLNRGILSVTSDGDVVYMKLNGSTTPIG